MPCTVTVPDYLAEDIENYLAARSEASNAEERGDIPEWDCIDDEAHSIIDCLTGLPRGEQEPEQDTLVDGQATKDSIRLTVTETVISTLHLHPERAPEGYDLTDDTDGLVVDAVAEATSNNVGDVHVYQRDIEGMDGDDY